MIAALQTDDHAVAGYFGLDAYINFASFTRHQIGQLSRLRGCGFACDVFLDEEDHGLERIGSLGHEGKMCPGGPLRVDLARPTHTLVTVCWDGGSRKAAPLSGSSGKGRGRRPREQKPREYVVKVKLSAAEKASMSAAAERAGLAVAAYLGQAGLDAAEHRAVPVPVMQQEMLRELALARGMVRRIGTNLNQAVAQLNATGQPGPDLGPAVDCCMRAVRHVDEAALLISRRLR